MDISFQMRLSNSRLSLFGCTPDHCLKKNHTFAEIYP